MPLPPVSLLLSQLDNSCASYLIPRLLKRGRAESPERCLSHFNVHVHPLNLVTMQSE